jgi:Holliday junction DNA helicase RuvB
MNDRALAPKMFSDFVGQKRVKTRLELAVAAAKQRNESASHILLVGPPSFGKTTLAYIISNAMGSNLKYISDGSLIQRVGDLAGLLTNLEEGDVVFISEIHHLPKTSGEYLYPAMEDFKLNIIMDQGPNARNVQLNLPRFTLVGATARKENLTSTFLSCFPIIETLSDYSFEELAIIARRFAGLLKIEIDENATGQIARSSNGTPRDILNRLHHSRDYAHVKGYQKITVDIAIEALSLLAPPEVTRLTPQRLAISSEVRREVWRRDEGKCVKCGSRENLEFDHILPVSKGGANTARNIELLCEACNRAKSDLIQ